MPRHFCVNFSLMDHELHTTCPCAKPCIPTSLCSRVQHFVREALLQLLDLDVFFPNYDNDERQVFDAASTNFHAFQPQQMRPVRSELQTTSRVHFE